MIQQREGVELIDTDDIHASTVAGGKHRVLVALIGGDKAGAVDTDRRHELGKLRRLWGFEIKRVEALHFVVNEFGEQRVAVSKATHLLRKLGAEVLASAGLLEGHTTTLTDWRARSTSACVAGALLLVELACGTVNVASALRTG